MKQLLKYGLAMIAICAITLICFDSYADAGVKTEQTRKCTYSLADTDMVTVGLVSNYFSGHALCAPEIFVKDLNSKEVTLAQKTYNLPDKRLLPERRIRKISRE